MKFKLDENLGKRAQGLFAASGHDVQTVVEEGILGISDLELYETCCRERRCLITFDLDFSDIFRFPPEKTNGIVIIRPAQNPSLPMLEKMIAGFLQALKKTSPENQLWIMETGRIRIHDTGKDEK